MATEQKTKEKAPEKAQATKQAVKARPEEPLGETLVRIAGCDIKGSRPTFVGLTKIKGISWAIANALCVRLQLNPHRKIGELTKEEIKRIEEYLPKIEIPSFMCNRPSDPETGIAEHLYGVTLDMRKEFDIKRLKEIKVYRGVRHALKQPVRGQRTRSHFRKKSMAAGMKKKKAEGSK
jgi:small subunit ribosomal protein S13